ncbi:hypothetical protein IFM89_028122 [Coptis chinensis]|uniref:F-box associated beta-propeller type 3 domain-containing protein n=1 Tax=Coptis chinensis TaxID=261450 RepID=A0A835M100_9MAGN|nr:hypothetical protein IFM89_028122 [Coptis chinensis]
MSAPSLVAMQLKQFTPILVVQNYSWVFSVYDDDAHLYTCDVMLLAVDGRNKIEPGRKQFTMSFMPDSYNKPSFIAKPSLIASFYGFLLFRSRGHALYIWNPVTQEQVTVTAPKIGIFKYEDCGLFFHTPTSEYRILYSRRYNTAGQNEFYVLSLRTAVLRKISNCTVSPCTCRPPIILNDRLHWMAASSAPCWGQEFPTCLDFILLFKMESEELITMPHPGSPCCSKERHGTMQLLEMEGQLGLCDFSASTAEFYLWVMEDYLNQVWVKRHIISLKPLTSSKLCFRSNPNYNHTFPEVEVVKVHHDELLLICGSPKHCHYYDLKLKIFRKVGRQHFLDGSSTFPG